jgi:hypothetical protein
MHARSWSTFSLLLAQKIKNPTSQKLVFPTPSNQVILASPPYLPIRFYAIPCMFHCHFGIASKLIGRYGGLTRITLFEGVGKTSFDLLDFFYFWASKREKVDQLHACISVHRAKQSMLNNVNKY